MIRQEVKEVAICMVRGFGLINLSRRDLCERAGIPDGSFPHIMGCNFAEFIDELKEEKIEGGAHVVSKSRTDPALRRDQILTVAVDQSKEIGYNNITRDNVAEGAGVSMGLVTRYFGTMCKLKRQVMRYAIKNEIAEIIAQGLANGDNHAKKAPPELKAEAATLLANL